MIRPGESLPHAGVAVFVTEVLDRDAKTLTAAARIPADHALVRDGRASSSLLVEAAAQAAALHGIASLEGDRPTPQGFLVALPRCAIRPAFLAADERFEVRVEHRRTDGPLWRWLFTAHQGDAQIGEGEFSVWSDA